MSIRGPDDPALERGFERAGFGADLARATRARFAALLAEFERQRPDRDGCDAWFVPGRIEILGKHTDYAGGRSLLCSVERGLLVVSAARDDGRLAITDARRQSSILLDPLAPWPSISWATYPATVLSRLRRNFPDRIGGADLFFDSDLPSASGLSSSSALMIAVLLVLSRAARLEHALEWTRNIRSDEDLAAYAASIENGSGFRELAGEAGVGTLGGSEDHTAILCSAPGRISQYAFRPTRRERSIVLPADLIFAVGVSGVRAQKTGNVRNLYNRASLSAGRILARWVAVSGRNDASLEEAVASAPEAPERIRALLRAHEPMLLDRFDQFVEESTVLVPAAGDQLEQGQLGAFGRTVARSQDLAERLLCNQVPETMALARLAREGGALAASAFGAGFGGSVWALVELSRAHDFLDRWQNAYAGVHPDAATRSSFFLSRPGPPAFCLSEVPGR